MVNNLKNNEKNHNELRKIKEKLEEELENILESFGSNFNPVLASLILSGMSVCDRDYTVMKVRKGNKERLCYKS